MELQLPLPGVGLAPAPPVHYRDNDPMTCEECGEEYPYSEGIFIDLGKSSKWFCCIECANDAGWVECEGCNNWINEGDAEEVEWDYYCDDCFNDYFFRCSCCNEITVNDESYSGPDGSILCERCFCDNYTYCADCNEAVHNDDVIRRGDEYFCPDCCPDRSGEDYTGSTTYVNVTERRFGVELEYAGGDRYECFDYFTNGTDHCGLELRSGILYGDGGLAAVRDLAEYAERHNWSMSNECGYHLHLDCRTLCLDQLKGIAWGYARSHALWESFVDPFRANCDYCCFRYPTRDELERIESMQEWRDWCNNLIRYRFVNWAAYTEHSTVEIRGHEGTLSPCEVCNWVTAHTRFSDHVQELNLTEIDTLFSGVIWRDFGVFREIVGNDIADFYANKDW